MTAAETGVADGVERMVPFGSEIDIVAVGKCRRIVDCQVVVSCGVQFWRTVKGLAMVVDCSDKGICRGRLATRGSAVEVGKECGFRPVGGYWDWLVRVKGIML